jgi:hypothetical protein
VRFHSSIVLALAASGALAQAPAAPHPDGRRLRLASDSLEVYVVRLGEAKRTGSLIDQLDTVRVNGETMLRRIHRTNDTALGTSVDTLLDTFATLEPHRVRSHFSGGSEKLDWQPSRVVGVVEEAEGATRSIDSPRPAGWYSTSSFELILRASPLADGYKIAIPSFSGRQGSSVLTATVVGSETIDGFGDTWRIEADFAGLAVTFWIGKSSRRTVRQIIHVSPGLEIMFLATKAGSST